MWHMDVQKASARRVEREKRRTELLADEDRERKEVAKLRKDVLGLMSAGQVSEP